MSYFTTPNSTVGVSRTESGRVMMTLDMSMEDARALRTLAAIVGGASKNSPRSLTDAIRDALVTEGVDASARDYIQPVDNIPKASPLPAIHFKDYSKIGMHGS